MTDLKLVDAVKLAEPNEQHFIINYLRSDDGENFVPISYEELPDEMKTDDVTLRLLDGMGAEHKGSVYIIVRNDLH